MKRARLARNREGRVCSQEVVESAVVVPVECQSVDLTPSAMIWTSAPMTRVIHTPDARTPLTRRMIRPANRSAL